MGDMMQHILLAAVMKLGGSVVLDPEDINCVKNVKVEFDPPADDHMTFEDLNSVTVSVTRGEDTEEDE